MRVPAGTSEIDALAVLLDGVNLTSAVVTADALHTQTDTATYLVEDLHADYILTVKRNQKTLFDQVKALPWAQAPSLGTTRDHGHGRAETRTVKAIDLAGRTGFPHAVQAVRLRRYVRDLRTGEVSWTCAYAVTSLQVGQADAAWIGALMRGHWGIEAWHHVKDVSLSEDACRVRCGQGPENLAALRALALVFLGRLGQDTVPDAIRWVSYEAFTRPLDLLRSLARKNTPFARQCNSPAPAVAGTSSSHRSGTPENPRHGIGQKRLEIHLSLARRTSIAPPEWSGIETRRLPPRTDAFP